VAGRTFVIGDIHGDLAALERLLERLPPIDDGDTVVFLGDYLDRGPDPAGVVARVRRFVAENPGHTVTLRGNHEDQWLRSAREEPDLPYLIQIANGCANTFRSFVGGAPLKPDESLPGNELERMLAVADWMPADVLAWMASLPLFYEDEHAVYVHAGLEGDDDVWKPAQESSPKSLLWMRKPDFFRHYRGKLICCGHTPTNELPLDEPPPLAVWRGERVIALDTGSGKGGFLSAVELPSGALYDSR
jgi:serine/threonine protein phosphatase 1